MSHNDNEFRVIEYKAKMTSYLESKDVPEMKMTSNPTVSQSFSKVQVKLPKIDIPTFDGMFCVGNLITSRLRYP